MSQTTVKGIDFGGERGEPQMDEQVTPDSCGTATGMWSFYQASPGVLRPGAFAAGADL